MKSHLPDENGVLEALNAADWDVSRKVEKAFEEELRVLTGELGETPTPVQFLERLRSKNIFALEFGPEGQKEKATLKKCHDWIMNMVEYYTLEPYSLEDFIRMEIDIMREEGHLVTEESVMEQLQARDGQNQETFNVNAPETLEMVRFFYGNAN